MTSGDYTLAELNELLNRRNHFQEGSVIGKHRYWGGFKYGQANGFGYFEYENGDYALGYWKDGMLDSEGKRLHACVYYRAEYDAHFFGRFTSDCAVEGKLFLSLKQERKFMQFQKLLKVYENTFWTEIMTPPPSPIETPQKWIVTPLEEYIVLYAWREHRGPLNNPRFEWRYYWKDEKMHICDIEGPLKDSNSNHNKEIADARYTEIISKGVYKITFQKIDFSGIDAVMQETRCYSDGTTQSYLLKDNEWKPMKLKALLKALPAVISPSNPA
jgi:hypothetical protein